MKVEEYELTCPEDGADLHQLDTIRKFGGVGPQMECEQGHRVFVLLYPTDDRKGMRMRIEMEGP